MKKVFITGGSGTVGMNFIEFNINKYKIYSYSRNEKSQVALKRAYKDVEIILGSAVIIPSTSVQISTLLTAKYDPYKAAL